MARIERVVAQQNLQPGRTGATQLSNALGQELSNAGAAVSDIAAQIQQRNEQRENFEAENAARKLDLQLEEELRQRSEGIEPGGRGFHESFMSEVYRPQRDAFLAGLPPRLRPKFEPMFSDDEGAHAFAWSTRSAATERDETYRWQRQEIGATHNRLATEVGQNPEGYDAFLANGMELINSSSLPTPEKEQLKADWETMAQTAMLNQMLIDDPHGIFRELGGDTRDLSPTTQFAMLSRAVQWQESRDNPNALSSAGAVGLMQVMPATAEEIAAELGDENFPAGAPEGAVRAYLSNPYVNKMYGEHYLRKQLKRFADTRDPVETALVAYNAGPSVAERWVESGYNDKVLPKETRDYKSKIMADISARYSKGDPSNVQFTGVQLDGVAPELKERVADAFASVGLNKVKVNSGYRSTAANELAHGAKQSEHLRGNALDLDVSGMKIADRIELIKSLSAAGITGIGVYANTIHADLGGRRAWGPSHGFESVPKWAKGVIGEHLAGTTPPIKRVAGRYGSLPYDKVQQFRSKADQVISAEQAAATKSTAVEKVQVRMARDNELALIRETGQGSPEFDETAIATILGDDDYLKFTADRDVAQRSFTAKQGIGVMTASEMEQRYEDYEPRPGADFASQQEVQAAVKREIDRVTRLRANRPDKAALEFPEIAGEYRALNERMIAGEDIPPAEAQMFVRRMLDTQGQLEIAPEARAPVPREWAIEIGKALSRVPTPAKGNAQELRASIIAQYEALQAVFGDYADEVIAYSLAEYTGISKDQAELLTGYALQLGAGTGIFRKGATDQVLDTSQVDRFTPPSLLPEPLGSFQRGLGAIGSLFGGGEPDDGLSTEERLRRQAAEETD